MDETRDNLTIEGWEDDEYRAFVAKFKAKKTTDDCYTPPNIYDAVADWVAEEFGLDRGCFVRPFWPGGDYTRFDYPEGCVVVDNPPFSILAKICAYYADRGIPFFLFAPALTALGGCRHGVASLICCVAVGASITYANGAEVPTSFLTSLGADRWRLRTAPELYRRIKAADDENRKAGTKSLPKYIYPDHIVTAALAQRYGKYGVDYRVRVSDCAPIAALDAQRSRGLSIFGGGLLLSTRAAAERAAAERAAAERWQLSEAEREMVRILDRRGD